MTNGPPAARAARPLLPDARVTRSLTVSDFDYELPPELIAQTPAAERTGSRLLHLDDASQLHDRRFADLTGLLRSGDLLVFNDTRVIKARLNGHKTTGGKVEVLVERITEPDRALAHVRASKSPGPGMGCAWPTPSTPWCWAARASCSTSAFPVRCWTCWTPTAPRRCRPITHEADAGDDARYQTVYAREPGAVAAPTAGLHFDQATLDQLDALGVERAFVTLHVGAGTFQPVRVDKLEDHIMHAEWFTVPQATVDAIAAARARRPRDRCRHHQRARPGIGRRADRRIKRAGHAAGRRPGRHTPVHHAGLPVPRGRRPGHQLPPAPVDPADAGVGAGRRRADPPRLRPRGGPALPLLQLRRRHVHRIPAQQP